MIVFQVLLHHIILPAAFLCWLALERYSSRSRWIATAFLVTSFIIFSFIVGVWAWVGYPLRFLMIALLAAALIVSHRRGRSLPAKTVAAWKIRIDTGFRLLLGVLFAAFAAYGLAGYGTRVAAAALDFPLADGVYVIGHGGTTPLINYHSVNPSQRYALDIVRLNAVGARAWGLYPSNLQRYAIFEDTVISPCAGHVVVASDGLPDLNPPVRDEEHPPGNIVVIECQEVVVHLAHLRQGSVRVTIGDQVDVGEPVGLVGNSGNTSEPHLHVHAERGPYSGESKPGVPMRFRGRFLVRNSLIW
jgi:hypothetical protein